MALVNTDSIRSLAIPESLQFSGNESLPTLDIDTLRRLSIAGWKRIGLLVAIIDSAGDILMLQHHARRKNAEGMLGPMGETSQFSGPVSAPTIEQPLGTLYRGIQEELGIEDPEKLRLRMHTKGGWAINPWPRGVDYPGQYSCGVSFPIYVDDESRAAILSGNHNGEEIASCHFLNATEIMGLDDGTLRPGVKPWLQQLGDLGLLAADEGSPLVNVDFSQLHSAKDIDLALFS